MWWSRRRNGVQVGMSSDGRMWTGEARLWGQLRCRAKSVRASVAVEGCDQAALTLLGCRTNEITWIGMGQGGAVDAPGFAVRALHVLLEA